MLSYFKQIYGKVHFFYSYKNSGRAFSNETFRWKSRDSECDEIRRRTANGDKRTRDEAYIVRRSLCRLTTASLSRRASIY